jgi:hypothetical protein
MTKESIGAWRRNVTLNRCALVTKVSSALSWRGKAK